MYLAPSRALCLTTELATYATPYRATVMRPLPTAPKTLLVEALSWLAGGVAFAAVVSLTVALLALID